LCYILDGRCESRHLFLYGWKTSCDESDDSHSLYHHVMSNNCLSIRDEDVECNLKKEGKLDIEGYAYISDTVMRLLSKHTGHIESVVSSSIV